MDKLDSLLDNSTNEEITDYLLGITSRMDIENCTTMVNTFMSKRFTIKSLIQYCEDNNIPYFKRGEFDIFTLIEIEYIKSLLSTYRTDKKVFEAFREKYPKRCADLTLERFMEKLYKLGILNKGKELGFDMRFTNDVVEFVRDLGNEHTIEESLKLVQEKFPELNMDENKIEEMKNRYIIKFSQKEGIFTEDEINTFVKLSQGGNGIRDVYNKFISLYPKKCDYKTFLQEVNNLSVMTLNTKEEGKFTPVEESYIDELLENGSDNAVLFSWFNNVFTNKYPYLQFVDMLNDVKNLKEPNVKHKRSRKVTQPEKLAELVDFLKSIQQEDMTPKEYLEKANEDERFKDIDYKQVHNLLRTRNISYTTRDRIASKNGTSDKPKRGIFNPIYDDVVEALKGNTINDAVDILKEKHPELKDVIKYASLRQYAKRNNLKYVEGVRGKRSTKSEKHKGRQISEKTKEIIKRLKEIAPYNTKAECADILSKEFNSNIPDTYLATLAKKNGGFGFKIYTEFDDTMKSFALNLLNQNLNKSEIYKEFNRMFPHKFALPAFYNCLDKLKLENFGKVIVHNTGLKSEMPTMILKPKVEQEQIEPNIDKQEELNNFIESNQQNTEQYQPIIDEVNSIFERKCHQLNITGDTHTHTDEIINALEILLRYANDKNKLIRLANDHEDVLEQYRREVEHEIELQPFSSTDTYCQNKLKAIGMRRREVKYTRDDLNLMSPLLQNIKDNVEVYEKTLEALKYRQNQRENSIFIPLVDVTMTNKYDWCRNATLSDKKAYTPILKTNARIDRINNSKATGSRNIWTEREVDTTSNVDQVGKPNKNAHRISTYRVKAEFLVLNGNPFVNRYYDVQTTNENLAKEKAKEYFDLIASNNDNAKYEISSVIRLNR